MTEVCLEEFCMSVYLLTFLILVELLIYFYLAMGGIYLYRKTKKKLAYKWALIKKRKNSKN